MEINNLKIQLVEYLNLRRKVVDQPNDLQYTDIYTCKHRIMSDQSSALYKYSRIENCLLSKKSVNTVETFKTPAGCTLQQFAIWRFGT